jgi:hypothetical protein
MHLLVKQLFQLLSLLLHDEGPRPDTLIVFKDNEPLNVN